MDKPSMVYKNKLQLVQVNKKGVILKSDNTLFDLNIHSSIYEFHPFFISTIEQLMSQASKTITCPGLFVTYNKKDFYTDVTITREIDYIAIMFFNYSTKYNEIQKENQLNKEHILRQNTKSEDTNQKK